MPQTFIKGLLYASIVLSWVCGLQGVGGGQARRFQVAFKYQRVRLIKERKIRHRAKIIIMGGGIK